MFGSFLKDGKAIRTIIKWAGKNAQRKRSDNYGFDKFIFYVNCTPHKNQAAYLINEKNGPHKTARIFV